MIPEHKNNRDLNIAWVTKWKKANFGKFIEIEEIINPSCLKVERAIIFFKSNSILALDPDINIVKHDNIKSIYINFWFIK